MKEMGVNEHLVGGRRKFLKIAALGSVGAPLVARAAPWGGGTTKPDAPSLPNLAGETRIAEVRAFALRRAVYVKVVADNGMAGWGEAGHSGGSLVAQLVNGELAGLVKGMDVFAAHPAWARMYFEADELGPSGLASQAIGGVDRAAYLTDHG